ncbi:MAG: calpastatin [Agrobacterium sp. SCN 61-19]|nr:MAG: calpastatin [Agrobacterium sp. SCN 61-19]
MAEDHSLVDLERFVEAQRETHAQSLRELQGGLKRSHWMWFIFPQLEGLGRSPIAQRFALRSLDEARAYLAHPILGERLRTVTRAVLAHPDRSLLEIFGQPDDMKFRSSMTLFAAAADPEDAAIFREALDVFCGGEPDAITLQRLAG